MGMMGGASAAPTAAQSPEPVTASWATHNSAAALCGATSALSSFHHRLPSAASPAPRTVKAVPAGRKVIAVRFSPGPTRTEALLASAALTVHGSCWTTGTGVFSAALAIALSSVTSLAIGPGVSVATMA